MRLLLPAMAVVLAFCGCQGPAPEPTPEPPRFPDYARPDLVGVARALSADRLSLLPPGPGAEGRLGDLVLENALARFVIGGADRSPLHGTAGQLLDAVPHGRPDRLRLLALQVGKGERPVAYSRVEVAKRGGEGEPAVVLAVGRPAGLRNVRMVTRYTLEPDSDALEIVTTVTNTGAHDLPAFGLHDLVCPGRSFRYSAAMGQFPHGEGPGGAYLAFYATDAAWGLVPWSSRKFEHEQHRSGRSLLTYGASDLGPGESRTCARRFVATGAGPAQIWREALRLQRKERQARVQFHLANPPEERSLPWFKVMVEAENAPSALLLSGSTLSAQVDVPPGRYIMRAGSPGYSTWGPFSVTTARQMTYQFPVRLRPPHVLNLDIIVVAGADKERSSARVVDYDLGPKGAAAPAAPPFPVWPARGVHLSAAGSTLKVPLEPGDATRRAQHLVMITRGPLYQALQAQVTALSGNEQFREARLVRRVNPEGYASVDFRQYDDRSPDSPLVANERVVANACEDVDVAVVAVPPGTGFRPTGRNRSGLVEGLRLEWPGAGCYTVWPATADRGQLAQLEHAAAAHLSPAALVRLLRRMYPRARIGVHRPFHSARGALALSGWTDPTAAPPRDMDMQVDTLEVLTGRDVPAARRRLRAWFSLLNRGQRVMAVGSSGSRGIVGDEAGLGRTYVRLPADAATPWQALREVAEAEWQGVPDSFVTNGPFLTVSLNGRPPGSVQQAGVGEAQLALRIQAPAWVGIDRATIYRNGRVAQRLEVHNDERVLRLDEALDVGIFGDCWFAVVVEGDRPLRALYGPDAPAAFAVTNPFWVDADGDGRVRVQEP